MSQHVSTTLPLSHGFTMFHGFTEVVTLGSRQSLCINETLRNRGKGGHLNDLCRRASQISTDSSDIKENNDETQTHSWCYDTYVPNLQVDYGDL